MLSVQEQNLNGLWTSVSEMGSVSEAGTHLELMALQFLQEATPRGRGRGRRGRGREGGGEGEGRREEGRGRDGEIGEGRREEEERKGWRDRGEKVEMVVSCDQ